MQSNPVCWFEIYVQDMARAKSFYEGVLGRVLSRLEGPDFEMWAFDMSETAPGSGGALIHLPGVPSGCGGTLVYFACEDCAVEEARVVAHGGQIHRSKISIGPYGFISLAVDPEGNMIGLHSLK